MAQNSASNKPGADDSLQPHLIHNEIENNDILSPKKGGLL